MTIIKAEEIRGYYVENEMVCIDCISNHEAAAARIHDIILSDDIERNDDLYFCDRCENTL